MWNVKAQVINDCLSSCKDLESDYMKRHGGPGEVLWRAMTADTTGSRPAPSSLASSFRSWASVRLAVQITRKTLQRDDVTGQHTLTDLHEVAAAESCCEEPECRLCSDRGMAMS